MKKLLSAGCSFIYGSELSDSPQMYSTNSPSLKTWPALYAAGKNLEYKTCAFCGASNAGITRYTINQIEIEKPDYVIVQWTFLSRYEIRLNRFDYDVNDSFYYALYPYQSKDYTNNEKHLEKVIDNLHPMIRDLSTFWYRFVDDDLSQIYYYLKTKLELANYLRYKNIPFVFTDSQTINYSLLSKTSDKTLHNLFNLNRSIPNILFDSVGFIDFCKNKNFDFGINHPLELAHVAACDLIFDDIDQILQDS
jgi:hypothetical protein